MERDIRGLPALIPPSTASCLNRDVDILPVKCSGKPTQGHKPCWATSNTRYASREHPRGKASKPPTQPVHERKRKDKEDASPGKGA